MEKESFSLKKAEALPKVSIEYYDSGKGGKPVVMIPGIAGTIRTYRKTIPQLESAGYRVIAVNLPGHGESTSKLFKNARGFAISLNELMKKLGVKTSEATLVGLCLGGQIAHMFAKEFEVKKTVMVSPQLAGTKNARGLKDLTRMIFKNIKFGIKINLGVLLKKEENINKTTLKGVISDHLAHFTTKFGPTLKNSPTTILAGMRDEVMSEQDFKRLASLIPNSELKFVNSHHVMVAHSNFPEWLKRELEH